MGGRGGDSSGGGMAFPLYTLWPAVWYGELFTLDTDWWFGGGTEGTVGIPGA